MTKKNKLLLLAAAVCLLIAICVGVVSCSGGGRENAAEHGGNSATIGKTSGKTTGTEKMTYTLVLKSEGGMPLEGVGVYFYTDSTFAELVWFAKTDAEGKAGFEDLVSDSYVAVLDGVPDGYKVEEYYSITGETTEIILSADMAEGDLANLRYKLGDMMMNFSVTAPDGTVYVLSELLNQKQAVVLNFWYLQCDPCRAEFPYLQEAYEKYSEKIEVLALNPINEDDEAIAAFKEGLGLTFPMAHCDPAWEQAMQLTAYPTTVIIDRYGNITLIHQGGIDESKVFEDAFEFFTADDYEQTTVDNIADLEIKAAGSNSENPIEIGGKTSFQVTVEPGQLVYYHLYRLDGLYLTINSSSAYVVYNGNHYSGTTGFTVTCPDTYTPAEMAFGNSGTTTQTYTVSLAAPRGTFNNPYPMELGEFTTKVSAGNDQGVYYMFTAEEDGKLTLQCTSVSPKNVRYDYTLLNEDTMAMRSIREDGDTDDGTVSISVKKGHKVRVTIGTLPDDSNSYPAATFKSVASLGEDTDEGATQVEKIDYAVTVTDANRKPISGVFMTLKAVETETEASDSAEKSTSTASPVNISTNTEGIATTNQPALTYDVTLTLPTGYTAATTQFQLSKANPFVSLKLDELIVEMEDYTFCVMNAKGVPVANALVTIGSNYGFTDENGEVTFHLVVGEYKVFITVDNKSYSVEISGENAEETIDLSQATVEDSGSDSEGVETYTVKVVDYDGKAQSGVVVQILKDGVPVALRQTGSDGKVTALLAASDYSVSLAFSGTGLYYEDKTAVLSESKTNLTIKVAPEVSGTQEELYVGNAYYLGVGGTYVTMQANAVNYFIFEPTEPGLYRFSTSDPEARLYYYGGNAFFINNMTSSTDYTEESNSFTRNVKQNNIGSVFIIGIEGASDCIVEIDRVSDPILDETDLAADIYKAKTVPKSYTIPAAQGRKLAYVDLTAKTSAYKIVMGSDGYYHLNSAGGPLLYMNLGTSARYVSMYNMLGYQGYGGTSLNAVFYDANGSAVRKEDYTECMCSYVECIDPTYGVYPLTEDLVYMVQKGGEFKGWWNPDSANCVFLDEDGNLDTSINLELGWMFAICYVP